MIGGIRFKVCGLTSLVDAECADKCGADFLGFNLYPPSPRYVPLVQFRALAKHLPDRPKVAVTVAPDLEQLREMQDAGFDAFQIHFPADTPLETIQAWSKQVSPERLWLAPKLPPEVEIAPEWLPFANTFLLDTYSASKFGGSGKTGDWGKFARIQRSHPEKTWVLAGGLNPDNVVEALRQSEARFLDPNSGVEVSPGIKDHNKLKKFAVRLNEARESGALQSK